MSSLGADLRRAPRDAPPVVQVMSSVMGLRSGVGPVVSWLMESPPEARARREREFHDARFAEGDGWRRSSAFYAVAQPSQQRFAQWIQEIPAGSKVLELGCGPGAVAWDLWDRGVEVTGIDISSAAIDTARSRAADHGVDPSHFSVGNAEALDHRDDSFDVVIGSAILHHVDLRSALRGIRRVLRPDGLGLFHEPLGRNPAINLYRRLTPTDRSADEHPLTVEDLELVEATLGPARFEYFHLTSLAALPLLRTRAFAPVHERLEHVDRWLMQHMSALSSYAWVVLIRARNDKTR